MEQGEKKQKQIQSILTKLNMKSIDELFQLDSINIHKIAHRSRINNELVQSYLGRLHQLILETQLLPKKINIETKKMPLIELSNTFPQVQFNIEEGELIQIIGRANAGKTFLIIQIIKLAIKNGLKPIVLCSGCHQTQYRQKLEPKDLMMFNFNNLCQLSMLVHSLGNHIIDSQSGKYLLIIDCLAHIELEDESIEFGGSQKFRRLISTFTNRTQTSIIYSYRINTSLFRTQYSIKFDQYFQEKIITDQNVKIVNSGTDGAVKVFTLITQFGKKISKLL